MKWIIIILLISTFILIPLILVLDVLLGLIRIVYMIVTGKFDEE